MKRRDGSRSNLEVCRADKRRVHHSIDERGVLCRAAEKEYEEKECLQAKDGYLKDPAMEILIEDELLTRKVEIVGIDKEVVCGIRKVSSILEAARLYRNGKLEARGSSEKGKCDWRDQRRRLGA